MIAVAIGTFTGSPFHWGIVVVAMAIFGYGLAALVRKPLGLGLVLAAVALVLATALAAVLPGDIRYAGAVMVWIAVLAGYGRLLIDRLQARRASQSFRGELRK